MYLKAALLPNQKNVSTIKITAWPNTNSTVNQYIPWIAHCLRYIRVSYATLIRLDLPSDALDIVSKFIDEMR